jgi:hypothetical protein
MLPKKYAPDKPNDFLMTVTDSQVQNPDSILPRERQLVLKAASGLLESSRFVLFLQPLFLSPPLPLCALAKCGASLSQAPSLPPPRRAAGPAPPFPPAGAFLSPTPIPSSDTCLCSTRLRVRERSRPHCSWAPPVSSPW